MVVAWGASDGLRSVVDQDIEAIKEMGDFLCKSGDGRERSQIKSVDDQALAPVGKVVFFGKAFDGMFGKARRDQDFCTCAQEFEAGGEADLAATACDDCASSR